jgi:hypothetical protein
MPSNRVRDDDDDDVLSRRRRRRRRSMIAPGMQFQCPACYFEPDQATAASALIIPCLLHITTQILVHPHALDTQQLQPGKKGTVQVCCSPTPPTVRRKSGTTHACKASTAATTLVPLQSRRRMPLANCHHLATQTIELHSLTVCFAEEPQACCDPEQLPQAAGCTEKLA